MTPLTLDDVLDNFHPLRSGTDLRGRIVAVQPETADAATIVIKPGRDWVGHAPGQYLQVGVDVDGVRLLRCYSLTHGPRPDGHISITVKAIPDGVVSQHLVHRARAGQMVHLQQAAGDFVLPMPIPQQLLLVTAGSGITPVIGMLRNLFSKAERPAIDITLVHVNQAEPDSIFKDELRAHARRRPHPARRALRRPRRAARPGPPRVPRAGPRARARRTPAARAASSTPSRSGTTPAA